MRLPHLDQRIHLPWGEAGQLAQAIEWVLCRQLEPPARPTLALVLSFGPLYRVRGRLLARHWVEQHHVGERPRRPWRLSLRYEEVAALLLIWEQAPAAGGAWGEIQRVSLNLTRYVDFDKR
ncbi:hypothetical protein GO988_15450 [Hymenobacter sp. HMF4947]|uniref:Uncharacterized protein n=1 Tax=Hymenobacter ginkgonis TaxID=2682976 RepID=A0A7K1TH53_9BACT|nr:hypothetical protein [Hymenobacter ginkgonis]MVN77728.1 hypothetical protein [Hymenobacter ginkgonis]